MIGAFAAVSYDRKESTKTNTCAADAYQCPDRSYVFRIGPDCQFAQCPERKADNTPKIIPTPSQTAIVKGRITLSPGCGIQTDPPMPNCGSRLYQTIISFNSLTSKPYTTTSNEDGYYSIKLPSGEYKVQAQGGPIYPSCLEETVEVIVGKIITKNIDCESGLR
jgi:hypothetical protein